MNDNYIIVILIAGSLVVTLFSFYITIFMVINKNKHKRFEMEKREMEFKYENEILNTKLEVQEQALNQVSQEIHDNIGQTLGAAQLGLYTLSSNNVSEEEKKHIIERSTQLLKKSLEDLRNVSHILNSEYINRVGLEASIKKELAYLQSTSKLKYEFVSEDEPFDLPAEQELMVFRIAQEAISNIVKHAHAALVKIKLEYTPSDFIMRIADDGKGFDPDAIENNNAGGIGIINMKQRVKLMNGQLNIRSGQEGTELLLSLNKPA